MRLVSMLTVVVVAFPSAVAAAGRPETLVAQAEAEETLAPGKVQLLGKYHGWELPEGDQKATYYLLEPTSSMRLRAGGPVSVLLMVRGEGKVTFKLDLDGKTKGEVSLEVRSKTSTGVYIGVPAGSHLVTIMSLSQVLVRPKKVKRRPLAGEEVVAWEGLRPEAVPAAAAEGTAAAAEAEPAEELVPQKESKQLGGEKVSSVLVLDTRPVGMSESVVTPVTTQIAEKLSAWPQFKVTTMSDVEETMSLEETRRLMGCREDTKCMAEASSAVKTDMVLGSSVGRIGDSVVVTLTFIDVKKSRPIGRASETVDSLELLPQVLPGVIASILGLQDDTAAPRFKLSEGQKLSMAVFDLSPSGVSKETAENLTEVLSVELKRVEGATVISRGDLVAMLNLEAQKEMLGCQETSCVAEIGGALGVDKLVVGNVGKLADSFMVSLRMIDPRYVKVDSRVTEAFQGTEDQLIRAVRCAGRRLLGIESEIKGKLAVSSSEEEAEVFVDSQKKGKLPMPPVDDLTPGRHVVLLSKGGFFNWQSDVYVDPGETSAVWAKLQEKPERWYQKWWVWTIVGVAIAGATTAAILLTTSEETPPPYGDINPGDANVNITQGLTSW